MVSGLIYATAFRVIGITMGRRGLAVPSAIMQLSLIIPVGLSVALWGERPDAVQVLGIVLALAALVLLAAGKGPNKAAPLESPAAGAATLAPVILLSLFLLQGLAVTAPKAFIALGTAAEGRIFLALLFGTAGLTFLPDWLGPVWFLLKAMFVFLLVTWIRWSFVRIRVDQILAISWKLLLPAALLLLMATAVVVAWRGPGGA